MQPADIEYGVYKYGLSPIGRKIRDGDIGQYSKNYISDAYGVFGIIEPFALNVNASYSKAAARAKYEKIKWKYIK